MKIEFENDDISRIKIAIGVVGKDLIARVFYDGKEIDNKLGVDLVNSFIKGICTTLSINVRDLFIKGVLSIENEKVWSKYDFNVATEEFVKKVVTKSTTKPIVNPAPVVEPVEETVKSTPVVEEIHEEIKEPIVGAPTEAPVKEEKVESIVTPAPIVEPPKEETKTEEKKEETSTTKKVVDKTKEVVDKTKNVVKERVTKKTKVDDTKKSKRIRNLKILGITALVLAAAYAGYELSGGQQNVTRNGLSNDNNNNNSNPIISMDDGTIYSTPNDEEIIVNNGGEIVYTGPGDDIVVGYDTPQEFTEPVVGQTPVKEYYSLGSDVYYDDMATQIQVINDECFKYAPTQLQNLVYENDRDAVCTIMNMRNGLFTGTCMPDQFLKEMDNYIFECGTVFDGKQIKTFDSLSPFAQYIVLVSGQSVLQLSPRYEHTTPNNYYNYDMLTNSYDYMVDSTYRTLTNSGKTY